MKHTAVIFSILHSCFSVSVHDVDSLGIQGLHCFTQKSDESLTGESIVITLLLKYNEKGE